MHPSVLLVLSKTELSLGGDGGTRPRQVDGRLRGARAVAACLAAVATPART